MVQLGVANSRMKDFYDVWTLARQFDFDGKGLSTAIRATFQRRQTALPTTTPAGQGPQSSVAIVRRPPSGMPFSARGS